MSLTGHPSDSARAADLQRGFGVSSPYAARSEVALAAFRGRVGPLAARIKASDVTHKAARQEAALHAQALRQQLADAQTFSTAPTLLKTIQAARKARREAEAKRGADSLLRELIASNERLRLETEAARRTGEFEARDHRLTLTGAVVNAVNVADQLANHAEARAAGDKAAELFYARRLESLRGIATDHEQVAISDAVTPPDAVNPRTVAKFLDAIRQSPPEDVDRLAAEAVVEGNPSALAALVVVAREALSRPEVPAWAFKLVHHDLAALPDSVLAFAESFSAEADRSEAESASALANAAAARAELEVGELDSVRVPTEDERLRSEAYLNSPVGRFAAPTAV